MAKTPLEKDTQKKILQWLTLKGFFVWSNKTQGTFDPKRGAFRRTNQIKGVPDILGILPDGRFLGIEVKRKPNKPSPEQLEFISKAIDRNALCFVAYSLEDVTEVFAYQIFVTTKKRLEVPASQAPYTSIPPQNGNAPRAISRPGLSNRSRKPSRPKEN